MDPQKHMAGRRRCLTLTSSFPHLVHVLLPHVSFLPPVFLHLPPFSLWTSPTSLTPHLALLRHIWALAHESGTVQTMVRKEGLGKNGKLEGGASHKAQSGLSHNPSPDTIYIYCIFFQCCRLRFILVSCKKKIKN